MWVELPFEMEMPYRLAGGKQYWMALQSLSEQVYGYWRTLAKVMHFPLERACRRAVVQLFDWAVQLQLAQAHR
jgi:hypothetical protein